MEELIAGLEILKLPGAIAGGAVIKWVYDKYISQSKSNWKDANEIRDELKEQVEYWKGENSSKNDELVSLRETNAAYREQLRTKDELLQELRVARDRHADEMTKLKDEHKSELESRARIFDDQLKDAKGTLIERQRQVEAERDLALQEADEAVSQLRKARVVADDLAKSATLYERAYNMKGGSDEPITRDDLDQLLAGISEASVEEHYATKLQQLPNNRRMVSRTLQNTPLLRQFQGDDDDPKT